MYDSLFLAELKPQILISAREFHDTLAVFRTILTNTVSLLYGSLCCYEFRASYDSISAFIQAMLRGRYFVGVGFKLLLTQMQLI